MLTEPLKFLPIALLLSSTGCGSIASSVQEPIVQVPIVLENVTLVDVAASDENSALHRGMSVVLSGDRIVEVGPNAEVRTPSNAEIIDGSGKFLIPGLFDMHVHLADLGDGALTALVVNGVTSARDLGGDIEMLDAALARVAAGTLVGPRVARAGYVLESRDSLKGMLALYEEGDAYADYLRRTRIGIASEEDVREALTRVIDSGADLLKIRSSPPADLYRRLVVEAKRVGLRIAVHEPSSIDIAEAASIGVGSLEHFALKAILTNTTAERWQQIHAAMVEHGMHTTPTLGAMRSVGLTAGELSAALDEDRRGPRWASLSPEMIAKWEYEVSQRSEDLDDLDWNALSDRGDASVRAMHEAGVPILAGTDLGLALIYPGLSLHDELVALVEQAGLRPLEALQAATTNAAAWLGWKQLGLIREGNLADLVLLEANPLEDISNVGRIHTVISRGVCYGPEDRERLIAVAGD